MEVITYTDQSAGIIIDLTEDSEAIGLYGLSPQHASEVLALLSTAYAAKARKDDDNALIFLKAAKELACAQS